MVDMNWPGMGDFAALLTALVIIVFLVVRSTFLMGPSGGKKEAAEPGKSPITPMVSSKGDDVSTSELASEKNGLTRKRTGPQEQI